MHTEVDFFQQNFFFSHNLLVILNKPTSELVIPLSPSLDLIKTNEASLHRSSLPPLFFYVCAKHAFIHLSRYFCALCTIYLYSGAQMKHN